MSSPASSASSRSRPMSGVSAAFRFVRRRVVAVAPVVAVSGASSAGSWLRMAVSSCRSSGPGSRPSSSASASRPSWKTRSASACRPVR